MDIKNLTTFIQVAELNSFTKAAAALGYSQSTISFQIRQLETELGTQLLERINHTVSLTEDGRKVLNYAHEIGRITRELTEALNPEASICGHVRLAMADSLCDYLMEHRFLEFRKQYPGITLKIIAAGTEEMFRLLNHNEVDMILTLDSHIYQSEYIIAQEKKIDMHFVTGSDSPLGKRGDLSVKELTEAPFILTEKGMSYRRILDEKLAERSLELHPILEIGSARLICDLIAQGDGVSFLPDYVTERDIRAGKLCYLNVNDFQVDIWQQLLYHRDKWLSPQMKLVETHCLMDTAPPHHWRSEAD